MPTKREPAVRKRLGLTPEAGGSVAVQAPPRYPDPPRRYTGQIQQMPNLFGIPAPYGVERPEYQQEYDQWSARRPRGEAVSDWASLALDLAPLPIPIGAMRHVSRVPKGMAGFNFPVKDPFDPVGLLRGTAKKPHPRFADLKTSLNRGRDYMNNLKRGYSMEDIARGLHPKDQAQVYQDTSRVMRRALYGRPESEIHRGLSDPNQPFHGREAMREVYNVGKLEPPPVQPGQFKQREGQFPITPEQMAVTDWRFPMGIRSRTAGVTNIVMPAVREPGARSWSNLRGNADNLAQASDDDLRRWLADPNSGVDPKDIHREIDRRIFADDLSGPPHPASMVPGKNSLTPPKMTDMDRKNAEYYKEWLGKGYSVEDLAAASGRPADEIRRLAGYDPDLGLPPVPPTPMVRQDPKRPYNQADVDNLMKILAQPNNRFPLMSMAEEAQKLKAQGLSSQQIAVMLQLDLKTAQQLTGEIPRYLPWE